MLHIVAVRLLFKNLHLHDKLPQTRVDGSFSRRRIQRVFFYIADNCFDHLKLGSEGGKVMVAVWICQ